MGEQKNMPCHGPRISILCMYQTVTRPVDYRAFQTWRAESSYECCLNRWVSFGLDPQPFSVQHNLCISWKNADSRGRDQPFWVGECKWMLPWMDVQNDSRFGPFQVANDLCQWLKSKRSLFPLQRSWWFLATHTQLPHTVEVNLMISKLSLDPNREGGRDHHGKNLALVNTTKSWIRSTKAMKVVWCTGTCPSVIMLLVLGLQNQADMHILGVCTCTSLHVMHMYSDHATTDLLGIRRSLYKMGNRSCFACQHHVTGPPANRNLFQTRKSLY